jgi:Protein of unknown function DUF262/Protein of unknown function (DUF1524)
MEASTTIRKMMAGNRIIVPSYQRAYSWETPSGNTISNTHTDVFLTDLQEYIKSNAISAHYFGHFLFEEKKSSFDVIDGQQRLTTIVIFLSALFERLKTIRELSEDEEVCYEDMVKRYNTIRFSTVDYDNQLFADYVINKTKIDKNGIDTESARRIVKCCDFFRAKLSNGSEEYLTKMLFAVSESTCTTHLVRNESEAIQMFIFQNNRGKKPSALEIVKAKFMYQVHLYGDEEKYILIEEIKNRFEKIYKSISLIEYKIGEDDILLYTLKVYFNSLWKTNILDEIERKLLEENSINFIKDFTRSLCTSFEYLSAFFGKDERENFSIHSLVTLGCIAGITIAIPFVIKAYQFGLQSSEIGKLCAALECLVLRKRLIGTRADLTSRISDIFEEFTEESKEIQKIIARVELLKRTTEPRWLFWNNESLEQSLQGEINHALAKYILWKYETCLEKNGNNGYALTRFDSIDKPELEHIAPTTSSHYGRGYECYSMDIGYQETYINCLGNYLLLSKSHNCAIGNIAFSRKRATYIHNKQQREIQELVPEDGVWGKEVIQKRKEKIIRFILAQC